jgi:excisionase family DNA binding protein
MNKAEAAEYLECSVRAIERYVQQGKISCTYQKGKTRSIAVFNIEELNRLKEHTETVKPAFETIEQPRQTLTEDEQKLAIFNEQSSSIGEVDGVSDINKLASMVEVLLYNQQVKASDKLLLTIDECRQLTGLSRVTLRSAITNGELKSKIIGKSWRIKRADLEAYLEALY